MDNVWGADLPNTHLIIKLNKGLRFLSCAIDIYNKFAWVIPLEDKNNTAITIAVQNISNESNRKLKKYGQTKAENFRIDQ